MAPSGREFFPMAGSAENETEVKYMPGPRQPTELVVANGRKHLTRAEEDERRDQEVHVPVPAQAEPPKWLPKKLHAEFRQIGEILRLAGLYAELDRDALGQYFLARERWQRADRLASKAIRDQDEKLAKEWTGVQSTYFRQCRQCAEVLGLSISSRCRLVIPQALGGAAAPPEEDEFTRALRARQSRAAGGG